MGVSKSPRWGIHNKQNQKDVQVQTSTVSTISFLWFSLFYRTCLKNNENSSMWSETDLQAWTHFAPKAGGISKCLPLFLPPNTSLPITPPGALPSHALNYHSHIPTQKHEFPRSQDLPNHERNNPHSTSKGRRFEYLALRKIWSVKLFKEWLAKLVTP